MKEYISKKYQKAKLHFNNFRQKLASRTKNMMVRLRQNRNRHENKK